MIPSLSYDRTNWFFKFCECLLTAIALLNLAMIPLELMPRSFWKTSGQYFEYVLSGTVAVALLSSILYTWFWHRRERMGGIYSRLRHAWMQGIIRYWLALSISK